MRQERTVQATIFEVFAQREIGCELKAMSQWLDGQGGLIGLVADDLRRQGARQTGRRGLPAESVLRCALLKPEFLRRLGLSPQAKLLDLKLRLLRNDPLGNEECALDGNLDPKASGRPTGSESADCGARRCT